MKGRYILLLSLLFCCVSCLKEDEVATTPQAAITSFVIGNYSVRIHDYNLSGRDTVAYVRENGYMYPMTIDQTANRIYNADSMAFGSDLRRVTTNVYAIGVVGYFYAENPDVVYVWRAYDSIDFTRKVYFRVASTDKSYERTYEVDVNIRKVFPDSLLWSGPDTTGFPLLTGLCPAMRNDTLSCFGTDATGVPSVSFRDIDSGNWNGKNPMTGIPASGWQPRVTVCGGEFFTVAGGTLYGSQDGLTWNNVRTGIRSIVVDGNDSGRLWAVSQDGDIIMTDDMSSWTTFQHMPDGFPDSVSTVFNYPLETNINISRSVLVGLTRDTEKAGIWTKLSSDTIWTEIDSPAKTELRLPASKGMSVIRYDDDLFCLGRGLGGFRQSNDNGITWYRCTRYADSYSSWNRYMQLPDALMESDVEFGCVTDGKGGIWIMSEDGRVWRGAIVRLKKY